MKKILLFALPMMIGLSACNQEKPAEPTGVSPTQETQTKSNTSSSVVRVAMTGIDEPFTFKDDKGSLTGLEYDILTAVAESQGFEVEPIIVKPNSLLDGLDTNNYEMVMAVMSHTPERASKYNVSKPYMTSPSAIMYVNPELKINGYQSLNGLRVVVGSGSFHEKDLESVGIKELVAVDSTYQMLQGLAQNKYDVAIQDKTMLTYTAKNYPDIKTTISPYYTDNNKEDDGIVMVMHKDNTELLEKVNKGIDDIKANGKMDAITQKWLGTPASP